MSERESKRIWQEFQRLYQLRPEFNVRANDQIFVDWEGPAAFTAENAILWLDNPDFRNRLARGETLEEFMRDNPAYDCEANRNIITQTIQQTGHPAHQVIRELLTQRALAFNKARAEEIGEQERERAAQRQKERDEKERLELARLIAKTYMQGVPGRPQELHYQKMLTQDLAFLRIQAAEIEEKDKMRAMAKTVSAKEWKAHIQKMRQAQASPTPDVPPDLTVEKFRQMDKEEAEKLVRRYGYAALNRHFGYVAPQVEGIVRNVNMEA